MAKAKSPVAALTYALWDVENSTRLERPEDYERYAKRARSLLYVMRYRTRAERAVIARALRKST